MAARETFWMRSTGLVDEGRANALRGKRVVVTRAAEQSEQLVEALKAKGAVPVILPMVAFAPPDDQKPMDDALRGMQDYDWVFLTSQNALKALGERAHALKLDLLEAFSGVKIAAVGPATAEAALGAGLRVAYVASKHLGTALAEELASEVHGKRVLLPRSDRANPELVGVLQQLGAKVNEVCAYKTIRPQSDTDAAAMTREADAVLFFSPSAVHHLLDLLGSNEFVSLSQRSVFAAIGPVTEQALHKTGALRVLLARDTSAGAVVESLTDYFAGTEAQTRVSVPRFKE
jgi:uroporphyrinogen-III synthase